MSNPDAFDLCAIEEIGCFIENEMNNCDLFSVATNTEDEQCGVSANASGDGVCVFVHLQRIAKGNGTERRSYKITIAREV